MFQYLRVLREQGISVKVSVVIGSQVTENTDVWSDVDLLVISPKYDDQRRRENIITI